MMYTIQIGSNIEIFLVDGTAIAHIIMPDGTIKDVPLPDDLHAELQKNLLAVHGFLIQNSN